MERSCGHSAISESIAHPRHSTGEGSGGESGGNRLHQLKK